MCKIVSFTNSKNINTKKYANKIGNVLLKIEKDGYGYAIQGENGVYGEKCVNGYFKSRLGMKLVNPKSMIKHKYDSFGNPSKNIGPFILHGRTSTNDKGLLNCHPMIKDDHYLIHNGVVQDNGPTYKKKTTNDSEDVLHRFLKGINQVEKHLAGYYAFTCIDKNGQLHVCRDDIADLFISWSDNIDSFIIATTDWLIEEIAEILKIKIGPIDEIKENTYMIFKGNELVFQKDIYPIGYSYNQAKYAEASLGKKISTQFSASSPHNDFIEDIDTYTEESFLKDIQQVDDTYVILDGRNHPITAYEFHMMDLGLQKECYIESPDGELIQYFQGKAS